MVCGVLDENQMLSQMTYPSFLHTLLHTLHVHIKSMQVAFIFSNSTVTDGRLYY